MTTNPYSPPTAPVTDPASDSKPAFIFRALTLGSLISYIATIAISQHETGAVADVVAELGYGGGVLSPSIQGILSWAQTILSVTCMAGLLYFSSAARLGLLLVLVSSIPTAALFGVNASSPLANTLWAAHGLPFMFMFGMAYFHPPIRKRFEHRKSQDRT